MTGREPTRCGYVALIGAPNVGKSTLLNALVGSKISIVTHKVQTTRTRLIGVGVDGPNQMIFLDTPGIFQPKRRLERAMVSAAWEGAYDADIVLLMIDATRGVDEDTRRIAENLKEHKRRAMLVINKVDAVKRERLLALAQEMNAAGEFTDTLMISALTGDGLEDLKQKIAKYLPEGVWLYPEDQLTDITERMLAAEITREKFFLRLHDELPYSATVETESWKELKDGSVRIEQVIYVERDSQKAILIGAKGSALKRLATAARLDIEAFLGRGCYLDIKVKTKENWRDSEALLKDYGLMDEAPMT